MNEPMIRKWFDIFKNNHKLTEIRILEGRKTFSGYFNDIDTLLDAIRPYDKYNIYFTLNSINESCFDREQKNKIIVQPKCTTSDNDIIGIDWLMIDIDVEKPSDTNSTDEEKELTKSVANNVYAYLRDNGFCEPVICDSANGIHLDYRIAMINNADNRDIRKRILQVLDMLFSTEKVKVDTTTFNAARVCKCYGVMSRKGSAKSVERPQRESSILRVPNEVKITSNEYLQKIADLYPKQEQPNKSNGYKTESFDIDNFISKYGIAVRNIVQSKDYKKYILEECPFDSSHRAPDSALFVMNNGAIGFKCLHNSCSQYTFKDFRLHYEPEAYSRQEYNEYRQKKLYYGNYNREKFVPIKEDNSKGKKWLSMSDIQYVDLESMVAIPTGYELLDKKIMGLLLGDVTVISGLTGTGKTSWLDCLSLNVVQRGFKVACWSGELQDFRFQGWIDQIAAGKSYVVKKEGYDNFYYAPRNICDKINTWLSDKLYLYNNGYGNNWQQLFNDIKDIVESTGVQLIILDNLMAMNLDLYDGDKYSKQTKFINDIKEYAKSKNVHIILVAHPRKASTFLRLQDISGTADLINLCDNLIIIHRCGKDFETRASDFWGENVVSEYKKFDSVLEVCKNRSMGVVDYVVGMYYEVESRRLKNSIAEHIVYGWQENGVQQSIALPQEEPNPFLESSDECPF